MGVTDDKYEQITVAILDMTDKDRMKFLKDLGAYVCMKCYRLEFWCPCEDNE